MMCSTVDGFEICRGGGGGGGGGGGDENQGIYFIYDLINSEALINI